MFKCPSVGDQRNDAISVMECYSATERYVMLTNATAEVNITNTVLSKRNQTIKTVYGMIPFT